MGLIVGLDFGTTYSMLSEKDESSGIIVPCKYDNKDIVEDSLVFVSGTGIVSCGKTARSKAGAKGTLYSGFKMLLNEDDPDELKRQHYDEQYSPRFITEKYLDEILTKCMKAHSVNRIERLVVGVPDIWDKQTKKAERGTPLYKNRNLLLKIIEDLEYVDDVELYSEPELASAYYLDNYKRITKEPNYSGNLLLIDYGGGTLDVAICKFDSDSKGKARVLKTFGEGWNENGKKGDAGLAFMNRAIDIAVEDAGYEPDDRKKRKCMYCLETALINMTDDQTNAMKAIFDNGLTRDVANSPRYRNAVFDDSLEYGEENLTVTYKHLAKAYMAIIDPVLVGDAGLSKNGVLTQARGWMDANGIEWRSKQDNKSFKIQLVGGFSNFYLVQKTVEEVFGRNPEGDIRLRGGFSDQNARNYAVSFGAALVANREITITRTAQYSLGLFGFQHRLDNGKERIGATPYFATHIKEEIIPGRIFLVSLPNGEPKIFDGGRIEYFAYCNEQSETSENVQALKANKDYEDLLLLDDKNSPYIFGLSFNKSLIISIYKWKLLGGKERFLLEYARFKRSKKPAQSFDKELVDHPEKYMVSLESCNSLDEIYTLTGVSLT